jgi:predicted SnoaL-like aldol condensation-catalyzing enzyme
MKQFVADHFDRLINRGDLSAIQDNVRRDYIDHNGLGDQKTGVDQSRNRTAGNLKRLQGLKVEIKDILGDGDKVVVRNVWTAFDLDLGERIEMHGFVLFRLEDGQLAERWATVTEPALIGKPHSTASAWGTCPDLCELF